MSEKFKTQVKAEFIPAIEELIKKEEAHLKFLKKSFGRLVHSGHSVDIDEMIERTEESIKHLNHRLTQYQQYYK